MGQSPEVEGIKLSSVVGSRQSLYVCCGPVRVATTVRPTCLSYAFSPSAPCFALWFEQIPMILTMIMHLMIMNTDAAPARILECQLLKQTSAGVGEPLYVCIYIILYI